MTSTLLDDVLVQARLGAAPGTIARRLGVASGLVDLALDHWREVGMVGSGTASCASCPGTGRTTALPLGCIGCVFAGR